MVKERTMNEIRQTKEYYTGNTHEQWANKANKSEEMKESRDAYQKQHIKECPLDPVEEAKILIVDKITKHFQDVMFEMVSKEMSDNYLFQVDNYLTPSGYDEFEDEWFEFFHNHHGDIVYEVMQNITN